MQIHRLEDREPRGLAPSAVTVGNFDGVHRGHQALVARARAEADALGGSLVVLTFDPHPSRVLSPDRAAPALMTLGQKAEVLAEIGVDHLAVLPFTLALAEEPPAVFARDVLARCLGARAVVVGGNFRYGARRSGGVEDLAREGEALGFRVGVVPPVDHAGAPVSSTRIREALAEGHVEEAAAMLGRPHFVEGPVVAGEGRGRTLGIPTANVQPVNELVPAAGVYAALAAIREEGEPVRHAVVNVGRRPTFGGAGTTVEAHLLDTGADFYGRTLRLAFRFRLRDERRFSGPEALVAQIRDDIAAARRLLEKPPGKG